MLKGIYLLDASAFEDCYAMIEFVRQNDPDQFKKDAAVLKSLLSSCD